MWEVSAAITRITKKQKNARRNDMSDEKFPPKKSKDAFAETVPLPMLKVSILSFSSNKVSTCFSFPNVTRCCLARIITNNRNKNFR